VWARAAVAASVIMISFVTSIGNEHVKERHIPQAIGARSHISEYVSISKPSVAINEALTIADVSSIARGEVSSKLHNWKSKILPGPQHNIGGITGSYDIQFGRHIFGYFELCLSPNNYSRSSAIVRYREIKLRIAFLHVGDPLIQKHLKIICNFSPMNICPFKDREGICGTFGSIGRILSRFDGRFHILALSFRGVSKNLCLLPKLVSGFSKPAGFSEQTGSLNGQNNSENSNNAIGKFQTEKFRDSIYHGLLAIACFSAAGIGALLSNRSKPIYWKMGVLLIFVAVLSLIGLWGLE